MGSAEPVTYRGYQIELETGCPCGECICSDILAVIRDPEGKVVDASGGYDDEAAAIDAAGEMIDERLDQGVM